MGFKNQKGKMKKNWRTQKRQRENLERTKNDGKKTYKNNKIYGYDTLETEDFKSKNSK